MGLINQVEFELTTSIPWGNPGGGDIPRGQKYLLRNRGGEFSQDDKTPLFKNQPYYAQLPHLGKMMTAS